MTRFIHLSDLHIHGDMHREENENCKKVVQIVCEHYLDDETKPVVLITGDITDDAKENQYRNAVTLLRPLTEAGFKLLACPGNHDYGRWGNFYTEAGQDRFRRHIMVDLLAFPGAETATMEDLFPTTCVVDDVVFIGVDSVVEREDDAAHFASGEVGELQRSKLAELLRVHSKKRKVVYFHHHPFDRHRVMRMVDAEKVMRLLAGRTDFLCFGHDHQSCAWPTKDGIDWVVASGKSTRRNSQYKFQFREGSLHKSHTRLSMLSFTLD